VKTKLLDFFPVPKTLAMQTSGLSVTDDAVQFVRFAHKNKAELEAYGEVVVPENVIEGGGVVEQKQFVDILKKIKDQYKLDLVDVSIPEEKSYLFKTSVLGENLKEIKSNIELKIQENVPFKLAEVVFDFSILHEDVEKAERDVVVSVLPRTVVDQYLDGFRQSGLVPVSFQVESQAVTQAVVPASNKDSVLVVHIKGDRASFYIVTGQTVRFSSTVDVGSSEVQVNMLSENLDPSEQKTEGAGFHAATLVREIKKILTYWKSHDGSDESCVITHMYLTGTITDETKLTDYIGSNIPLPVEIANVWQNAFSFDTTIPDMKRGDSLRFAAAIGLALPNQE
jgi:type IV pilus assembly protein PilM